MLAVSRTAAADAVSQTGVSERRTGAEAARARRARSTGVPHVTASHATTIAACTAVTASVAEPSENTLFGQWGPHWSSGVLQRWLERHRDPEQPQHRHRAAGQPQEPQLGARRQVPGGVGQDQIREHQRHQAGEQDPDAERHAVARAVQQPQRREQPDGDQQPPHPRLDLARLRVQASPRSAPTIITTRISTARPGGLRRGVLRGQQPDRGGRRRADDRDAAEPQGQRHRRPQRRNAGDRFGRAGLPRRPRRDRWRFGVLERSALRLAGGNLGTHDSASIPGTAFRTWAVCACATLGCIATRCKQ